MSVVNTDGNGVVPFGKYKGQPVEVLMADDGYRDWLLAQPWFRERHANIYQVVINYGGEPADSPEHNEMQAAFLDDERCLRLTDILFRRRLAKLPPEAKWCTDFLKVEIEGQEVCARNFEVGGWDVQFRIKPEAFVIRPLSTPPCTCACDHGECAVGAPCGPCGTPGHGDDCPPEAPCRPRTKWGSVPSCTVAHHRHGEVESPSHCDETCRWTAAWAEAHARRGYGVWATPPPWPPPDYFEREPYRSVLVELKPDIGDDFPAVLRQVLRYDGEGRRCVVVRRHAFQSVTWDQVKDIFAASDVWLIAESEIHGPTP